MKEKLSVYLTKLILICLSAGCIAILVYAAYGAYKRAYEENRILPGIEEDLVLYDTWEVTDGITLHLLQDSYPPGTKTLTLVLENRSDNVMLYGEYLSFEKYENGAWQKVKTIKNYGFRAIGYTLFDHDKHTFTISTWFLKEPLSSGTYRVTGCSLRVARDAENLSGGGDNIDYPPYKLTFTVCAEATPEPEPQPKKELAEWQLPDIEPWQWHTPWDCFDMYHKAGLRIQFSLAGGNGLIAILYGTNQDQWYSTDLLLLDVFDRKTGKRYQVFTEPTLGTHSVMSFDQGFIIVTDNVYYYYLDDNGKLVIEPLK